MVKPRIRGDDHGNGEPPACPLAQEFEHFVTTHTPRDTQKEKAKTRDHQEHADPVYAFQFLHSGSVVAMELSEAWRPVEHELKNDSNSHHDDVYVVDPSCFCQPLSNFLRKDLERPPIRRMG